MDFSTTTSSNTSSDLAHRAGPPAELRTWYDDLNSPLIQSDGNDKSLKLRFDVSQYAPEEIVVKTVDNKLLVIIQFEQCLYYLYRHFFTTVNNSRSLIHVLDEYSK